MSPDYRYAFVSFNGVGFGRFDLTTYSLTHSYGSDSDYGTLRGGEMDWRGIFVRGTRIFLLKSIAFPGTAATGLQVDLHDLADPNVGHTITRPPVPGAGNLVGHAFTGCSDGRFQWTEGNTFVTLAADGATITEAAYVPANALTCPASDPEPGLEDYPQDWGKRTDLVLVKQTVQRCAGATCSNVRTLPAGTKWAVFSKSGTWLTYEANGFVYRDKVDGGNLKELPTADYAFDARGGRLVSATRIYDIDADAFTVFSTVRAQAWPPLAPPVVLTNNAVRYLPNGVIALATADVTWTHEGTLLVNATNETVHVDGDKREFTRRRPGLLGPSGWLL